MALLTSLRETLLATVRHGRLWLVQFIGNALLLLCFIGFLRFPDAYVWQVVMSGLLILLLAIVTPMLHGGTLNYFLETEIEKTAALKPPFRNALKHALPLILWAGVFYFLFSVAGNLEHYQYSFPGYLLSKSPAWLRRIISESTLDTFYRLCVWSLSWIVIPGVLLPFALLCADRNFRGFIQFRIWWRMLRNAAYWVVLVIASLLGVYCTDKLLDWRLDPKTATLQGEEMWLGFRLFIVYMLMIFSWLWVCAMLARARLKADTAVQKSAA